MIDGKHCVILSYDEINHLLEALGALDVPVNRGLYTKWVEMGVLHLVVNLRALTQQESKVTND